MAIGNVAGRIWFAITADNRQFNTAMKRSINTVSDSEKRFRKLQQTIRGVSRSLATPLIGYATLRGLQQLAAAIKGVTESSATLVETSRRVGFTTERLQLLGRVVEGEGGSFQKFISGLDRFSRAIGEASDGIAEYKDAFDRIGVSVVDGLGRIRGTEQIFDEVVEGLSKIESPAKRIQTAYELFGRANLALVNAALKGVDALNQAEDQFREFGVVTDDENVRLKRLDQTFKNLTDRIDTIGKQMVADLEPAVTRVAKAVELAIGGFSDFIEWSTQLHRAQDEWSDYFRAVEEGASMHERVMRETFERMDKNLKLGSTLDRKAGREGPRTYAPEAEVGYRIVGRADELDAALDKRVVSWQEYWSTLQQEARRARDRIGDDIRGVEGALIGFTPEVPSRALTGLQSLQGEAINLEHVFRGANERAGRIVANTAALETGLRNAVREGTLFATVMDEANEPVKLAKTRLEVLGESASRAFSGISDQIKNAIVQTESWGEAAQRVLRLLVFSGLEALLNPSTLGGLFGGVGNRIPLKRASGGPLRAGVPAIVGERGPELVIANRDSYVVPNSRIAAAAAGGAASQIIQPITINVTGSGMNTEALAAEIVGIVEARTAKRGYDRQMRSRAA